jgi:hypothetical protein
MLAEWFTVQMEAGRVDEKQDVDGDASLRVQVWCHGHDLVRQEASIFGKGGAGNEYQGVQSKARLM